MVERDWLHAFAAWAWARHHNVLSWYIRPLFFVPYAYFAYHHSPSGILLTILGLATSMFWFPAPQEPSQAVLEALEAEREYLLGVWPWWKVCLALLVPLTFAAIGAAFWRRSWWAGLGVINSAVLFKVGWTTVFFRSQGSVALHAAVALTALAMCDVALLAFMRGGKTKKAK